MNNIADKIKQYFSSNFGKLYIIISALSFIITLILSVLYKNRVDVSLLKAIFSGIITMGILFLIGILLRKYLGDVIDDSNNASNLEIDYNAADDNNTAANNNLNIDNIDSIDNITATANNNNSEGFNPDSITISPTPMKNVDKKSKSDYHSSGDDIGDIVFGKTSSSNTSNYNTSSSMFPNKKIDNEEMIKEVHEDPEKVAKAVRTMIAKDEKDDK